MSPSSMVASKPLAGRPVTVSRNTPRPTIGRSPLRVFAADSRNHVPASQQKDVLKLNENAHNLDTTKGPGASVQGERAANGTFPGDERNDGESKNEKAKRGDFVEVEETWEKNAQGGLGNAGGAGEGSSA
ncbi:hypothetical protein WJX72_000973 [[Myrmecia] bisecta]|uniref:Uncharacterized protein n=1 Tax=[Myrmecia] bisecta TaxID=41462 RepID=A0AAW1PGT6_9CHLO